MASFTTEAKNAMLDTLLGTGAASGTYCALINGIPTDYADAKVREVTGGVPAYARKQVNLTAAATGSKSLAAQPMFDVPAGAAFDRVAWWRVATGGVATDYLGSDPITPAQNYAAQGVFVLTAQSFSITG